MKIFLPLALCAVLLTGCKTIGADMAAYIAAGLVLNPVFDATVEGSKAAYVAIEEYWAEWNREGAEPLK